MRWARFRISKQVLTQLYSAAAITVVVAVAVAAHIGGRLRPTLGSKTGAMTKVVIRD